MPFQDKYRSFIYVHDGAFEGEATAYDFTVDDSATPIGGFYASGESLAEVVLHNTSATNSILVKAKSGTVGSALSDYAGIYKLEPLESRKFIFGSDMFFALANYTAAATAVVHISALNATVTEPSTAPEDLGPVDIASDANYTFGPVTVAAGYEWRPVISYTSSAGNVYVNHTPALIGGEIDNAYNHYVASSGAQSYQWRVGDLSGTQLMDEGQWTLNIQPAGTDLTGVTVSLAMVAI